MAESDSNPGFSSYWPVIMAVLTAAGGALLYFSNLQSDRPQATPEASVPSLDFQDVTARLWQDPLEVVNHEIEQEAEKEKQSSCCIEKLLGRTPSSRPAEGDLPTHLMEELCKDEIKPLIDGGEKILVLGIMISGGPYAELGEQRLRQRVAVLEGLASRGFESSDGNHIGYVNLNWYWKPRREGESVRFDELCHRAQEPPQENPLLVPYEWCQRSALPLPTTAQLLLSRSVSTHGATTGPSVPDADIRNVLVLWLNEDALQDHPMCRLAAIVNAIKNLSGDDSSYQPHITFELIGPRVSTTLRAMAEEADPGIDPSLREKLDGVTMFSPTASADDNMLLRQIPREDDQPPPRRIPDLLRRATGLNLIRTNFTDDVISRSLFDELLRRCNDRTEDAGDIAIVSEWDTFYGKALPISFAAATTQPQCAEFEASRGDIARGQPKYEIHLLHHPTDYPPKLHPYFYLRGIDGNTPADNETSSLDQEPEGKTEPKRENTPKYESPGEAPEGLNQSDYLRRLADQLADLDRELRAQQPVPVGLTAVCVLGTDLYDKLLILRALRDRLPGVVFGTIDLDARYMLPKEWPAAHNLIVVSSYGLTLDRYYQHNVPPFRDSNQTAVYAATLFALGNTRKPVDDQAVKFDLVAPRRFEIGRTGVFDISPPYDGSKWQPLRQDYSIRSWKDLNYQALVAVALAAFLAIPIFLFGIRPTPKTRVAGVWANVKRFYQSLDPILFIILAVLGMWFILAWFPKISQHNAEPISLIGGISIWPTEAVRCLALGLCFFFITHARRASRENDQKMQKAFHLAPLKVEMAEFDEVRRKKSDSLEIPQKNRKRKMQLSVNTKWHVFGKPSNVDPKGWAIPASSEDPDAKVYAQSVWWHYQLRGNWWMRSIRFWICSLLYCAVICAVIFFIFHTKFPIPARGQFAARVDLVILVSSVAASIVLVFFVLDAAYLNRQVILHLTQTTTHWPDGASDLFKEDNVAKCDLTEILDIRFIADRTKISGQVIYYPFIIFLLMILSRNSFFDDWSWPAGLIFIFAMNFALAILAALILRSAAEQARSNAMERISHQQRGYAATADPKAKVMNKFLEMVQNEDKGAFSILSGHPILAAILLPAGSIGAWIILQYFSNPM